MKNKRIHDCNVLETGALEQRLWQFEFDEGHARLEKHRGFSPAADLPPREVSKDWHHLFQRKVNIAWLPAGSAFFRVVQLPKVEVAEALSMLEFQLERLSPLPVAQVVWGAEMIGSKAENNLTAIVCIVSRDLVEDELGILEKRNYQPDILEIPMLIQILAGGVKEEGVWLYPATGQNAGWWLAAWWTGGVLRNLQLLKASAEESGLEGLRGQLMQTAWAGEMEGWLQMPVRWHLVAESTTIGNWPALMADWSELPLEIHEPLKDEALARFSAERADREEPGANLLPAEYAVKYRQQFIDRLWMRGIGAVVGVYIIGVMIYFVALSVQMFRQGRVEENVVAISSSYTNVLKLKEQVSVMQEQLNLKYAALDCWKAASDLLPEDFTLTWLIFGKGARTSGSTLELHGSAPQGKETVLIEYNEKLRDFAPDGQLLFKEVTAPNSQTRPGAPNFTWRFSCELNRSETE